MVFDNNIRALTFRWNSLCKTNMFTGQTLFCIQTGSLTGDPLVCECVFLYMLHSEDRNMHFTCEMRTWTMFLILKTSEGLMRLVAERPKQGGEIPTCVCS